MCRAHHIHNCWCDSEEVAVEMRTFSIADVSNINAKPSTNFSGTLSGYAPFNIHVKHILQLDEKIASHARFFTA